MPEFYTTCFTPSEHKALIEFIELHSTDHVMELRSRNHWAKTYTRVESAINKINNSRPVVITK